MAKAKRTLEEDIAAQIGEATIRTEEPIPGVPVVVSVETQLEEKKGINDRWIPGGPDNSAALLHEYQELKKQALLDEAAKKDLLQTILDLETSRNEERFHKREAEKGLIQAENELVAAKEMLRHCYEALNTVVRKKLNSEKYNDTYALAADLSKFLKGK